MKEFVQYSTVETFNHDTSKLLAMRITCAYCNSKNMDSKSLTCKDCNTTAPNTRFKRKGKVQK